MDTGFQWVITVAVVLACIAFLVQAGMVIAMYRTARRLQETARRVEEKVAPLTERAEALLATARQTLEETRPKLTELSNEALELAKTARQQTAKIAELVEETAARARFRIAQIDERVDQTVEQVGQVGGAVKGAVVKPLREANAVLAGVRAALITYISGRRYSVDTATQDEEMFI